MLSFLKRRRERSDATARLYDLIVAEARRMEYFTRFGVPDTVDGRFDMLAAMVHLVLRRYRGAGQETAAQALFDLLFHDMDRSLREMGAGDLGVAPRVKKMAEAFYGRVKAYDEGLDADDGAVLSDALDRNLYRGASPGDEVLSGMAGRLRQVDRFLEGQDPAAIAAGEVRFPDFEEASL